jgi:hypothetical protein
VTGYFNSNLAWRREIMLSTPVSSLHIAQYTCIHHLCICLVRVVGMGVEPPNGLLPAKTRCPARRHCIGVRRRHARLPQRRITTMWIRTLTILAMLIFMMLASGWALVQVVLDVVPMPNRCRPLTPGQCRCRHSARRVRIANLHDRTGYNMMFGVQLGNKI